MSVRCDESSMMRGRTIETQPTNAVFVFAAVQMVNSKKIIEYNNDTENYSIEQRTTVNLTSTPLLCLYSGGVTRKCRTSTKECPSLPPLLFLPFLSCPISFLAFPLGFIRVIRVIMVSICSQFYLKDLKFNVLRTLYQWLVRLI